MSFNTARDEHEPRASVVIFRPFGEWHRLLTMSAALTA
jgi:hypothetical protein